MLISRCVPPLVFLLAVLLLGSPAHGQPSRAELTAELTSHAITSCGPLRIEGSSIVDSQAACAQGEACPAGAEGHVRSNSGIELLGTSRVAGDATAGPGATVHVDGSAAFAGAADSASAPFDCTPLDLDALRAELEASHDNAVIPLTAAGVEALGGADGRAFALDKKDTLTLAAGRYLFSSFVLRNKAILRVAGRVDILVTGEVSISGGAKVNPEGSAFEVRLFSSEDSLVVAAEDTFNGYLTAPDAAVQLAGRAWVRGGVWGREVTLTAQARVSRAIDFVAPSIEITSPVEDELVAGCLVEVSGRVMEAEAFATVTVNGVEASVGVDGTFTALAPVAESPAGLIVATATDLAGNTATAEVQVRVAPPALALLAPAPGSLVGTRLVDLAGTSGDATAVTVEGSAAEVPGDGSFSLAGFDLGEDGAKTLTLVARNCAATRTIEVLLDLDTRLPVVAIDSPASGALFGLTPIQVGGTVEDAHLANVTVNGVVTTVEGGRFVAAGVPLAEGANTLVAVATDALGRSTASAPIEVVLDTSAPRIEIDTPAPGAVLDSTTVTVEGLVGEPNLAALTVNGVSATVVGGRFSAAGVALVEGENFLVATAVDQVGNSADSPSVVVVRDTLAPVVSVDAGALTTPTTAASVVVIGTAIDPHLAAVTVKGVAATVTGDSWVASGVPLAEGENAIVATATDSLGHQASSTPVTVVRDSTPPQVAITEPLEGAELATTTVTVRGTVADPHLDEVVVRGVAAVLSPAAGGNLFEAVDVTLTEGVNTLRARATDTLGNQGTSAPVTVLVDTLAPIVRIDVPAEATVATPALTITGTVSDPHLEEVRVGDLVATLEGTAPDFTFTVEGVPLVEGENQVVARATDRFGNAADSDPVLFVLDTEAPVITLLAPADGEVAPLPAVTVTGTVADPNLETLVVAGMDAPFEPDGAFAVEVALEPGENAIAVLAADAAGNAAEVVVTVLFVPEPPTVTLDAPALPLQGCLPADTSPAASGTIGYPFGLVRPVTVTFELVNAAGVASQPAVTISPDGRSWTTGPLSLGAVDGTATARVTVLDAFGKSSAASAAWRVDATAPELTLITAGGAPLAGQGDGPAPPPGATPVLVARALALSARVADGDASAPPVAALTLDGATYVAGTPIAAEGDHLVVASAVDCAGHETVRHAFFRIDTTAPALLSVEPADGARLVAGPAQLSGAADSELASATVDGAPAAVSGTGFVFAPFPWREGENRVAIELLDLAGNRTVEEIAFEVRTVPLTVEWRERGAPIAEGQVFLRAVAPELAVSDPEAVVTATLDGAPFVAGAEVATAGAHTLAASATDAFGRSASSTVGFEIDLAPPPSVTITSPLDGDLLAPGTITVEGTVSASAVAVEVNGRAAVLAGGAFTLAGLELAVDDALVDILAIARDARGRTATASVTLRVSGAGPQVLILEPASGSATNRARVDVAGAVVGGPAATADGTVRVALSGSGESIPLAADGSFRARDVALASGVNVIAVEAVDALGRTGSAEVEVLADFSPPALSFEADGAPLADGAALPSAFLLRVAATDDGAATPALTVRLNGEPVAVAGGPGGSAAAEVVVSEPGGYVIEAVARDTAGNSARAARSFVLGRSGCVISDFDPPAGSVVAGAVAMLRGRAPQAVAVTVRVEDPPGSGSFQSYPAALADGTFLVSELPLPAVGANRVDVVCAAAAGGSGAETLELVRLGDAGPTIEITTPPAGALLGGDTVDVAGAATGALAAGDTVVGGVAAALAPAGAGFSFSAAGRPLVEGPNVLSARATDAGGRVATDRVLVARDSRAPKVQITSPESGALVGAGAVAGGVAVTGVVDLAGEPHLLDVTVSTAQGSVLASVDPVTGAFRAAGVPLDATAGAGATQAITASARDALGHVGSSTVEVRFDAAGPAIDLAAPAEQERVGEGVAEVPVSGSAWGGEGAQVTLNGVTLDPATLAWSAPDANGRRQVSFSAAAGVPSGDGPFGVIARVVELDGRAAQDRRLLLRDTTAPRVIELSPADGEAGVDPDRLLLALFSEPVAEASLALTDGLTLVRLATGDPVAGQVARAGNAVAFAPAAALRAGESYRLRAGLDVADLGGIPLEAAVEATFTVAEAAAGATAPLVDPVPAVLCADRLALTGQAPAGAEVMVQSGTLSFSGFADQTGRFAVTLPISGPGFHFAHVRVRDEFGRLGPETKVMFRVDCDAPSVLDAIFDRGAAGSAPGIVVLFSEPMDPATLAIGAEGDALRLALGDDPSGALQPAVLSLDAEGRTLTLALDAAPDAWWRERAVRLRVGAPAADLEGHAMAAAFETVFFPGGGGGQAGGFLFGEAYDDTTGRPLEGVSARLYDSAAALPGTAPVGVALAPPVLGAATDGRGRYVMVGSVAPGRYAVFLDKPDHAPVVRRLAIDAGAGVVPFDARLTPRAAPAGAIDAAAGGAVLDATSGLRLEADAAALPASGAVEVTLTPLSGQGLPDLLPLGWTPVAAAELVLREEAEAPETPELRVELPDGRAAGFVVGGVRVDLPFDANAIDPAELWAVQYERASGRWTVLDPVQTAGAGAAALARVAPLGPGAVALVVPDADPATRPPISRGAGDPLLGAARPAASPELAADLAIDPPVVPPTGRARARIVARSADLATPWPSGLAVQAFLEEQLTLAGGAGDLFEVPFAVDLVLYRAPLTAEERAGAPEGAAGVAEIVVSPSPRAAQVVLDVGWETVRVYPFPETVERGSVLGPRGGSVTSPDGVEVLLAEGALGRETVVGASLLEPGELALYTPIAGFDVLGGVRLDLGGETLARPATLRIDLELALPPEVDGDPRLLLAEWVGAPIDGRGAYPALAARMTRQVRGAGLPDLLTAAPEPAGGVPLEGIVREGVYLVLRATAPIGWVSGTVRAPSGAGVAGSRASADGLGAADVSRLGGGFAIPAPAAVATTVRARHPALGDEATTAITLAAGQHLVLDLTVAPRGPELVALAPPDGALEQPTGSVVTARFDERLDPASVGPGTITVELAGADGRGSGAFVEGAVSLAADGVTVLFGPRRALPPGRELIASFHGGVRDEGGAFYAGASPVTWRFRTGAAVVHGGLVDPSRIRLLLPEGGVAQIVGEAGALPTVPAGSTPWAVSPEIEGPLADPVTDTFQANASGGFTATVGHPATGFPVGLGSKVWLRVFDPAGGLAATFRLGPFAAADGRTFVAQPGEVVHITSADGVAVRVPAGAFDEPTLVTTALRDPATLGLAPPASLVAGAVLEVAFTGAARESLRVELPAPAGAAGLVLVGAEHPLPWGRRWRFVSAGSVVDRGSGPVLSIEPGAQPQPAPGSDPRSVAVRYRDVLPELREPGVFAFFVEQAASARAPGGGERVAAAASVGDWTLVSAFLDAYDGAHALYDELSDAWVFVPPSDFGGAFVLPVLTGSPFRVVDRDVATGWVLSRRDYDPVLDGGVVTEVPAIGGEVARPRLIDAAPFELVRFAASPASASYATAGAATHRLRLDVEAVTEPGGAVTLRGVPGFRLPAGATVTLLDYGPSAPLEPDAEPAGPIAGRPVLVCADSDSWSSAPLAGSHDLVALVTPGDLDPRRLETLELQFDQRLVDLESVPVEQVATLEDLGPIESACPEASAPRSVPLALETSPDRTRVILRLQSRLPAGHRFRLRLDRQRIAAETAFGDALPSWPSAPAELLFATRPAPADPIGTLTDAGPAASEIGPVRDLLQLGNLMIAGSDAGARMVAFDVSDVAANGRFAVHAVQNQAARNLIRGFATDGHDRLFYTALLGSIWAVRGVRAEDARAADAACAGQPEWAAGLPCFDAVAGTTRIALFSGFGGGLLASEYLALGGLPQGSPKGMEILTQDETGAKLELAELVATYGADGQTDLDALAPDAGGGYRVDLAVRSTASRFQLGLPEPSRPDADVPGDFAWRETVCEGEQAWDRYQRVTVDNLTTGQSWSFDVENPWPSAGGGGGGSGTAVLSGIEARRGDRLRVRYNVRALGYVAVLGSGVTVIDLNRGYRVEQPTGVSVGSTQCGRLIGRFEGAELELPQCAPANADLEGIAQITQLAVHSETGSCSEEAIREQQERALGGGDEDRDVDLVCRGHDAIDLYTPVHRIGIVHARSALDDPGGIGQQDPDAAAGLSGGLQAAELALACPVQIGGRSVRLRDVELANEIRWVDRGLRGDAGAVFAQADPEAAPRLRHGDLLFATLGEAGVLAWDVSSRSLGGSAPSGEGGPLVGHLREDDHWAFRLQVDAVRGLLFVGALDASRGFASVIDVYDLAAINGGPDAPVQARPIASLDLPWIADHLAIDQLGTGLVYSYGDQGPVAAPFGGPRFRFSGLYRPAGSSAERPAPVARATARFVPLGAPLETAPEREEERAQENEEKATAAFKLRIALPGSFGEELTARVQSLREAVPERLAGRRDLGAVVLPPGGPGWPEVETVVTLRRVAGAGADAGGRFGAGYHLYESRETVVLLADPRARRGYQRQELPAGAARADADEETQCRRCAWPSVLPAPGSTGDEVVVELLAGRFVRAFLDPAPGSPAYAATVAAIARFEEQGSNYPLPSGVVEVAGFADEAASPAQVSLGEPAQGAATWSPGEAGVAVALASGDLLLRSVDHAPRPRVIPFAFERTYRSGLLGYSPLGSAGWSSGIFQHLRELASGEVEYHDSGGRVWRFLPRGAELPASGDWEDDPLGSYQAPKGLYLRLQKLSAGRGWRLLDRHHGVTLFDARGRLAEISDRHRQAAEAGERGSTLRFSYDAFGQLVSIEDDLARSYTLEYDEDPGSPHYGLLRRAVDFVGRGVEYEYGADRELVRVLLPEVGNEGEGYGAFAHRGASRPALEYGYDPAAGVPAGSTGAPLHGEHAALRLASVKLPAFLEGAADVERARFEYDAASGRVAVVSFPTPENAHPVGGGVRWRVEATAPSGTAGVAEEVVVTAPWQHEWRYALEEGRIGEVTEELDVVQANGSTAPEAVTVGYEHTGDGRVSRVRHADGGVEERCYVDGEGAGCEGGAGGAGGGGAGSPGVDRLALANVVSARRLAGSGDQGSSPYASVAVSAAYQDDNLPSAITDGLGRPITVPVAEAGGEVRLVFGAESVGATQRYDAFGRVRESAGDGAGGPRTLTEYGADSAGRARAGLPSRVRRGSAFSTSYAYDASFNVEAVRTSQGTVERRRFDEWDRPVRVESGVAEGGSYATVGAGPCEGLAAGEAGAEGAAAELAYDAAGHVVRERRLQQHLTGSGATACRWVETRYRYNAREQVVAVEQTHLASPTEPGTVVEAAQEAAAYEYDEHGRALRDVARNAVSADLATTYRYDAAGRVVGVTVGQAGELVTGYDAKSRPVLRTDGDAGVWRGRWDAWDRLYREEPPTGAVVVRQFDEAHQPIRETIFDGAPELGGERLVDRAMAVTSFGEVARLVELLDVDPATGVEELRVTERAFDEAGRVVRVLSGPPTAEGALDPERARRELERVYEADAGRVLVERFGGGAAEGPLWERVLSYAPENRSPWPDAQTLRESVPGEAELRETWTTRWQRDAFGRPVAERRDDGRVLYTTYDRTGGAIATRTGAGTTWGSAQDGRGLPVALLRPAGRGATRYAYDLDGRALRKVAEAEPESGGGSVGWEEVTLYDATGRAVEVQHEDGTSERLTYYPDNLVASRTTREGVLVSYQYDAANRLLSAVPSAAAGADGEPVTLPSSLAPLDAGDAYAWDALSRRTASRRGRDGVSGYDASLEVAWPSFDLASRSREERVGARGALAWSWDTWNRPVGFELPSAARIGAIGAADPLRGWTRQYDTLDRLVDLATVGAAAAGTPGATWAWGGRDRLYAMTTRASLITGLRLGYLAGAGAQPPGVGGGDGDGASRWRLGTLVWGGAADGGADAGSGADSGATTPPMAPWGSFGYAWRGSESSDGDALKIGRAVLGASDAFAGLGWTIGYDAAERVAEALPGAGSLIGSGGGAGGGGGSGAGAADPEAAAYRFEYGVGDELARRIDERTGEFESVVSGADGRLLSIDGESLAYDAVGRRTEDPRFRYQWSWRGELVRVEVKPGAEAAWGSPYEGHLVRYAYDGLGRLASRVHWGVLPDGESDDALRPFIERRDYLWEDQGLLAEIGYNDSAGTQVRWRKVYVPGPGGLDDAVQVVVQSVDGSEALYTILRDEMGSVLGIVAEDEAREGAGSGDGGGGGGSAGAPDPARPVIPVRYRYTPFGAALAETSPLLERVFFDNDLVEVGGGAQAAVPADDLVRAAGALRVAFSAALDAGTLASGVVVESREAGGGGSWAEVPAAAGGASGAVMVLDADTGTELRVMLVEGWLRGVAYRVRLRAELRDVLGRAPPLSGGGGSASGAVPMQWTVAEAAGAPTAYEQRFAAAARFESWAASADPVGGRFPGGQNGLFHGLWTDPVSGISYARARWYDARTGGFLSEDPLRDIDSPNLYQYGLWSSYNVTDPLGLSCRNPMTSEEFRRCQASDQRLVEHVSAALQNPYVQGFLQVAGGAGECAIAASAAPTGIGTAAAVVLAAHCADLVAAGSRTLVTGESAETLTYRTIASTARVLGADDRAAQYIAIMGEAVPSAAATTTALRRATFLGPAIERVPATSTVIEPRVIANRRVGNAAADSIAARFPGAQREVSLQSASGRRVVDVLTDTGLATESKVGRTSLTRVTRQQIARDVELLEDPLSPVAELLWEFFPSPTTGRVGPTSSLANALQEARIQYVLNRTPPHR